MAGDDPVRTETAHICLFTLMGDGLITMLQVRFQDPDLELVTTAPVMGQPAAAYPAAPRNGRAGLFAVPALATVGVFAVLGVVLSGSTSARLVFALLGLAVPVSLYLRQRTLAGDLHRSQSSFRTLVKSSVDPVVILDDQLRVTYASESFAELLGYDPASLIGLPVTAPVHPDDRASLFSGLRTPAGDGTEVAV